MAGDIIILTQIIRKEVIGLVYRLTLFGALTYFGVKWMVKALDPTRKQKVESQKRAERILNRIGVKNVTLSEYELSIAAQLVDPTTINITWEDIAGLEEIIQEIRETVILPIQKRELFSGSMLIQPPKGVLLHGPPGCDKTMIAKATAREAGARFINLEVSSLTDKWYGESQKLAAAVFSLAIKIQPCIIFIDEIDSFLRSRDSYDHEAIAMMKAQFMSLWDGLITDADVQVIVMGATNRPQDVDRAILRRMPAMFHIGLPTFRDWKLYVKGKASRILQARKGTGGGPALKEKLSCIEEKLVEMMGEIVVQGNAEVPETPISFEEGVVDEPSGSGAFIQDNSSFFSDPTQTTYEDRRVDFACSQSKFTKKDKMIDLTEKFITQKNQDSDINLRRAAAEEKIAEALTRMANAAEKIALATAHLLPPNI